MNEILTNDYENFAEKWPLMSTPLYPILILILYWWFVFKLGPRLMKNRPAFDINKILITYNAYQVIVSSCFCLLFFGLEHPFEAMISSVCGGLKKDERNYVNRFVWWYFFTKITELLDTIFFVLRKKQSQVTFLHVYHHSIVMGFSWIYVKYLSDGHFIIVAFINSIVHVVMYSYYLMSALGPKYKKYAQWKKHVTWMQLSQFGIGSVIVTYMILAECSIPLAIMIFYFVNNFIFVYLFTDFYIKTYCKKSVNETKKIQ